MFPGILPPGWLWPGDEAFMSFRARACGFAVLAAVILVAPYPRDEKSVGVAKDEGGL